jgi:flavoprotein
MESLYPQEKALEIWNIFLIPCDGKEGKIKEYTEYMLKHNKVHYTISAIRCVGVILFCELE